MGDAWKNAPVVFEWYGDYDYLKSKGWSFDAAVNFMLKNHVTMINDNVGRVPPEAMPQLEKLARLAGYRFVLRELAHEKSVRRGAALDVKMKWANVGVGKLYRPFQVAACCATTPVKRIASTDATADPRDWLPGEHDVAVLLPVPASLPPGEYTLAVAVSDPANQHPPLQLAMDAPAKLGWYQVSRVKVE